MSNLPVLAVATLVGLAVEELGSEAEEEGQGSSWAEVVLEGEAVEVMLQHVDSCS